MPPATVQLLGFEHLADMVQKEKAQLGTGAIGGFEPFVTPLSVACAGLPLLQ